jgi:hypothetical protein
MKHVFVALGQHHISNFENLIDNRLIKEGETILLSGPDVTCNTEKWDTVIHSKNSFNNNASSVLNRFTSINTKIKTYKNLLKQIGHLKNEMVTVYVCYIEDVLSNYLFFSFGKETKAIIVEDGTLNYYNHSLRNIDRKKFLLKQLFASLHGISFKRYKGHSSGAEYNHVVEQYLRFPKNAFITKNAKQLPVKKETIGNLTNSLFIVGQESYGTLIGQSEFESALNAFLSSIKAHPFYDEIREVYYKPHRNGKQLPTATLINAFPEKDVSIIQTDKTSEEVYFEDLKAMHIAGFDSSTLINIYSKLEAKDNHVVKFYVNPLKNDELVPLFKNLNFTFLNSKKQ